MSAAYVNSEYPDQFVNRHRQIRAITFYQNLTLKVPFKTEADDILLLFYIPYVNVAKGFDTVTREGLLKIMMFGCPVEFIAMVRPIHDGMLASVHNYGEFPDPFPVTNGVKQGCVLASTLFSMMFSAMLTDAFQDGDNGLPIRYRFDGKLFNLRSLQAKSKVQTEVLDEFLFDDDIVKIAPTEEKMQNGVDQVSDSSDRYDLTINIKKTEVVYQWAPGKPYNEPTITVKGQRLQLVDKFSYLGSTLSGVDDGQYQDCLG